MKNKIILVLLVLIAIVTLSFNSIYAVTEPYKNNYTGTNIENFKAYVEDLYNYAKEMDNDEDPYIVTPFEILNNYKKYFYEFQEDVNKEILNNSQIKTSQIEEYQSYIETYEDALSRLEKVLEAWKQVDESALLMGGGVSKDALENGINEMKNFRTKDLSDWSDKLSENALKTQTQENNTGAANEETEKKWKEAEKEAKRIIKELGTEDQIKEFNEKSSKKKVNQQISNIKEIEKTLKNNCGWSNEALIKTDDYDKQLRNIRKNLKSDVEQQKQEETNKGAEEKINSKTKGDSVMYQVPNMTSAKDSIESTIDDIISKGKEFVNPEGLKEKILVGPLQNLSGSLYGILLAIAMVFSVIIGGVLGIELMVTSAQGKAKVKESLVVYVIACTVIFGAFAIWKIVYELLEATM